ncbi:hypothetical protein B0H11DRAFT_1910501 [Mycena galericulata]|nr:hypothetical protein B0H11DRAFT_1910501 [Mycena galericulata]
MYMFFGLVKTGNGIKIVNGKKARLFIPRAQRVEESGGSRGRERVLRQWQAAGRLVAKRQRMRRLSAAMRVEHGVIPPAAVNRGKNKRGKWAAEGDARVGGNTARRAWTNCQYQMHPAKGRRTTSDGAYWRQKWLEEAAPIRAGASIPGPYRRHPCARKVRVGHRNARIRPQASRRVTAGAPDRIERRSGVDDDERRRRTTSVLPMVYRCPMSRVGQRKVSGELREQSRFYAVCQRRGARAHGGSRGPSTRIQAVKRV